MNPAAAYLRPAESADEIGRLAHYRVLRLLGRGGMGMVFEAEDQHLRRHVALKVIRPDLSADQEIRRRFLYEAQAAAALKNDHVVTIYHVGEDAGVMFLAMELLRGRSLEDWLKPDRRATVGETLILGRQMARGLAAAHAGGLIHRDIKPANLWLEAPRARLKILDFGLARILNGSAERLTDHGELLGTPSFMPPEHVRGESGDHRGDLFSLGCVLYRMVTGKLPFAGDSISAVLHAITSKTPAPVSQFNPSVPPRLSDLIDRLLAKLPDERFPTAQAVVDEFVQIEREWKHGAAGEVAASDATLMGTPLPVSRRRFWLVSGGLAIAALGGVGWQWFGSRPPMTGEVSPPLTQPLVVTSPRPREVDLLALIDVASDQIDGRWERTETGIVGEHRGREPGLFRLAIPWEPPLEYRLSLAVKRIKPMIGHCAIGLASGDHLFTVLVDHPVGTKGQMTSGVNIIDAKPIEKRSGVQRDRILRRDEVVTIVCTVRRNSVTVTADDVSLFEWEGDLSRLQRKSDGLAVKLFLGGSHNAGFEYQRLILEPLGNDVGHAP